MSYPGTNGTIKTLYTGGLFHCYMLDETICNFRGVRLSFFRNLYKKMAACFANSGDPDQMPPSAASDLDLHSLPKYPFWGTQSTKG